MSSAQLEVRQDMTGQEMREYYIEMTRQSLHEWEAANWDIHSNPPFDLEGDQASSFTITKEIAEKIKLRNQIEVFAEAGCDLVSVLTVTYAAEGLGISLAAREAGVAVVVYFTLERDGRLPDGSRLREAIGVIDAVTDGYVAYYGINCAHPDHMAPALADRGEWTERIGAVRANASRLSHAELDEAELEESRRRREKYRQGGDDEE